MAQLSEKQLEANRANAQHSTGPKTEEGKRRSSLNATRHGLTGQVLILPEEEHAAFQLFTKQVVDSYDLENKHEETLCVIYATSLWQIQQAQGILSNMFTLGLMEGNGENLNIGHPEAHNATAFAKTFRGDGSSFGRISLYLQRLTNQAQKMRKELEEVLAARRERQKAEIYEAARAYKFKKMQGEEFVPAENGFVCSTRRVELHIRRHDLATNASGAEKCDFNRERFMKQAA